jgi:hypothetical protein
MFSVLLLGGLTGCQHAGPQATCTACAPAQTAPATAKTGSPNADLVLLPQPRKLERRDGSFAVQAMGCPQAGCAPTEQMTALLYKALAPAQGACDACAKGCSKSPVTTLSIDANAAPKPQGYVLDITPDGIRAVGHDEPGLFYAVMTVKQIARQNAGRGVLPCVHIEDWPDFPNRGAMLDISRDKVPEMETLYAMVDRFAEWKFNQIQLYTEHTFAYRDHYPVWRDASPMTPEQIQRLDAYCKARYIELVPNQNSFGHMGRWLQHPEYQRLGEMPGGGDDLCPIDPDSVALLKNMYDDLLPNFSSKQINVGCDETWSLGKGRSKDAVAKDGVGRVYLGFIKQIHGLVSAHGSTMQFWGDIIMQHPELIPELPKGVIAMEWGYEANHPFAAHGKKFAQSGIPFYVVPGTSAWNSLAGRTDNTVKNLRNAAENGFANGAIGFLVTDWGDGGNWQFLPAATLGFAYGAAVSWANDANKDIDIPRMLDVNAFEDTAGVMGRLAYDLGNAHLKSGIAPGNSTVYYHIVNGGDKLSPKLTVESLQATIDEIDRVLGALPNAKMQRPDASLIAREFTMTGALMKFTCHLGQERIKANRCTIDKLPVEARQKLAAELAPLLPDYRRLWVARNRTGGLRESVGRWENLLGQLNAK